MGGDTKISWTDATWNPVRGCSRVSPGCEHCYAERVAGRFSGPGKPYEGLVKLGTRGARWNGKVSLIHKHLHDPLAWRDLKKIFVNSMSDLFHENLPFEHIAAVYGVMMARPHTYQILTKRPERALEWYRWAEEHDPYDGRMGPSFAMKISTNVLHVCSLYGFRELEVAGQRVWADVLANLPRERLGAHWPLPHVWMGVSVENRKHGLPRIDVLREIPARIRFLSVEPLLEDLGDIDLDGIDWVIVGCESGPGHRECKTEWIRNVIEQCRQQRVPIFVKQAKYDGREDASGQPFVHDLTSDLDPPATAPTRKSSNIIERPYIDGTQHLHFPMVTR